MIPSPQYVILFHHFRRLLEALAQEGMEAAPLKGAHLLTSVYPDDEERGMIADVDFLVRERDWSTALRVMEQMGFRRRPHVANETMTQEVGFNLKISEGSKVLFEAHRHLFNRHRLSIDHDAVWARSVASTFEGVPCRRLCTEDHFCHIALHTLVHRLDFLPRTLRDLELLLVADPSAAPRVVARAREWRITRVVWLFLRLLARRNPALGTASLAHSIVPPRLVKKAMEIMVPDERRTRLYHLNHRLQAAVLWPVFFDTPLMTARFAVHHPIVLKLLGQA